MGAPQIKLEVAGDIIASNIDAEPAVRSDVDVQRLTRNYDGPAELAFSLRGQWLPNEFAAGLAVRFWINGDLAFEGRTNLPRIGGSPAGLSTDFICHDGSSIYRAATTLTGNTAWKINTGTLASAVAALFTQVGTQLGEMGLSITPVWSPTGAAGIPTLPVAIENLSVDDAVRKIAAAAPGVRVFVDPNGGTPAYHFVQLFGSLVSEITIGLSAGGVTRVVSDVQIERSLEGRCGAVRCNSRQASGSTAYTTDPTLLTPAWDTALESTWTLDDWKQTDAAGAETAKSLVFRKFSFAGLPAGQPSAGAQILMQVSVPVGSGVNQWMDVEIDPDTVDLAARTITLKEPLLLGVPARRQARRNALIPGNARAASARIKFREKSSGTVTVPGTRYPTSGFAGTAYGLDAVAMAFEQPVEVPEGIDQASYAAAAHAVLSEPTVKGSLTLENEMPDDFYRLARRINIRRTVGVTGYEDLRAPLMAVDLRVLGGPTLLLDFSTERTLPGGA